MLGTSDRIGEALALRKRDVNDSVSPMQVTVAGTLVVVKGKGVYRQDHPKTSTSRRVLQVPEFTAKVLRRRLDLLHDEDEDHLLFYTRNKTSTPGTRPRCHRTTSDARYGRSSPTRA